MLNRIIIITLFVYFFLAAFQNITFIHPSIFEPTRYAYYNYLIDAFLHGRTYVEGTLSFNDLSLFKDKWYLYWGTAPILLIFPFYVFSGIHTSDIVYTAFFGICNVILFYFVLLEFRKHFNLKVSNNKMYVILFSFAFASPHLFLSTNGGIWHTNHIMGIFYLLTYYLFFIKYLHTEKRQFLVLSIIFFNLSWLSRYTFIFNGLFFLYPLFIKKEKILYWKEIMYPVILMSSFFIVFFFSYNFVRFHSVLETGHQYSKSDVNNSPKVEIRTRMQKNLEVYNAKKIFSIQYIPENFFYYFLNHLKISLKFPFLNTDIEGSSIFSVYPLTLLIFYLFQKKYLKSKKVIFFVALSAIVILSNLLVILSFTRYSHWSPFGTRYILDILPLLFLLFLFIIEEIPIFFLYSLTLYGILVNFLGITLHMLFFVFI